MQLRSSAESSLNVASTPRKEVQPLSLSDASTQLHQFLSARARGGETSEVCVMIRESQARSEVGPLHYLLAFPIDQHRASSLLVGVDADPTARSSEEREVNWLGGLISSLQQQGIECGPTRKSPTDSTWSVSIRLPEPGKFSREEQAVRNLLGRSDSFNGLDDKDLYNLNPLRTSSEAERHRRDRTSHLVHLCRQIKSGSDVLRKREGDNLGDLVVAAEELVKERGGLGQMELNTIKACWDKWQSNLGYRTDGVLKEEVIKPARSLVAKADPRILQRSFEEAFKGAWSGAWWGGILTGAGEMFIGMNYPSLGPVVYHCGLEGAVIGAIAWGTTRATKKVAAYLHEQAQTPLFSPSDSPGD